MSKLELEVSQVESSMSKALELGSKIAIMVINTALESKSTITKEDMILIERAIEIHVKDAQ